MAIQFPCPVCGKAIEVDAEFAGQSAQCPYCRDVVTVPHASTLGTVSAGAIEGQPAEAQTGDIVESPTAEAEAPSQRLVRPDAATVAARRFGTFALVFAFLAVACIGAQTVYVLVKVAPRMEGAATQPTPEQVERWLQEIVENDPVAATFVMLLPLAGAGCALLGLALAIASLSRVRSGNWRGIVALIVCAGFLLVFCAISANAMAGGV